MTEERFNELLGAWIDGEISPADAELMEACLREDPARVEQMRSELHFADLLEQQLRPCRSYHAFVNGLETRIEAEKNGEEFIRELIPKLREVDRRKVAAGRREVVVRPERWRERSPARGAKWLWASLAGGLAAAATVVWVVVFLGGGGEGWGTGRTPVASITEMDGVVWEGEKRPIEWKVGDQLRAGEGVKLLSGRARFRMNNGTHLTLEGPADLQFLSESEGILRQGAVLADGRSGGEPFRIHGLGAEIEVEPGSVGVRMSEGDRTDAMADRTLAQTEAAVDAASQKPVQGSPEKKAVSPEDAASSVPEALPHFRIDGEGAPVLLVLEDDNLRPREPIRVDVMPGDSGEGPLASHEHPEKRRAIESVSRVRSYLVQVGDSGKGSEQDSEYVDATVRFDRPILGISTMEDTLEKGDALTGYDPQQRLGGASEWKRGLRAPNDFVHIREDGKTLDLRVRRREGDRVPQLRVFVEGE